MRAVGASGLRLKAYGQGLRLGDCSFLVLCIAGAAGIDPFPCQVPCKEFRGPGARTLSYAGLVLVRLLPNPRVPQTGPQLRPMS